MLYQPIWQTRNQKKVIESGWLAAGIRDAMHLGLSNLPSIDLFEEIVPMKDDAAYEVPIPISAFAMCSEVKSIEYSSRQNGSDDDVEVLGKPKLRRSGCFWYFWWT